MTKSQLVECIAQKAPQLQHHQVETIVNVVFDSMMDALKAHQRIELRGFGSFAIRARSARTGRNPKTGKKVQVPARHSLLFTVGKELRERLNVAAVAAHSERPRPERIAAATPNRAGEPGNGVTLPEPLAAAGNPRPSYSFR